MTPKTNRNTETDATSREPHEALINELRLAYGNAIYWTPNELKSFLCKRTGSGGTSNSALGLSKESAELLEKELAHKNHVSFEDVQAVLRKENNSDNEVADTAFDVLRKDLVANLRSDIANGVYDGTDRLDAVLDSLIEEVNKDSTSTVKLFVPPKFEETKKQPLEEQNKKKRLRSNSLPKNKIYLTEATTAELLNELNKRSSDLGEHAEEIKGLVSRFTSSTDETQQSGLVDHWRKLTEAKRKKLREEFKQVEIEEYHKIIFGSLDITPTVEGFQEWCNANVGNRFESVGITSVAKALQYFRSKFKVDFGVIDPDTGKLSACRVEGHVQSSRSDSEYFEFLLPGRGQPRVTSPSYLPKIELIR